MGKDVIHDRTWGDQWLADSHCRRQERELSLAILSQFVVASGDVTNVSVDPNPHTRYRTLVLSLGQSAVGKDCAYEVLNRIALYGALTTT